MYRNKIKRWNFLYRHSVTFKRDELERKSAEISETHRSVRAEAEKFGNAVQLERLKMTLEASSEWYINVYKEMFSWLKFILVYIVRKVISYWVFLESSFDLTVSSLKCKKTKENINTPSIIEKALT